MRVARLLEEGEEASVLALTFTNKAAGEMRERVDNLLGKRGDRAHLTTFHAFATEVLHQHGSHLGLKPDFSLLTQDEDRIAVLEPVATCLENDGYELPGDRRNLLTLLDRLFSELYEGSGKPPALLNAPDWLPLLFQNYCDALVAENRLDFGSLLSLACRLLRDNPGVARVLRLGWSHVCVDEFQDTNKAQYELLKLILGAEQPNLFVVADDDQIIYQWKWTSPASTDRFTLRCPSFSQSNLLEVRRTTIAQSRVQALAVVEALQILEERRLRYLAGWKLDPTDQLGLQGRHKRFRDGVIQSRAYPTHRGDDARLLQSLAKREGRVLLRFNRSWRRVLTSLRNLLSSCRSSVVSPSRSPASILSWFTQFLRVSGEMPNSRATSEIDLSEERYRRRASDLNSGGYCGVAPGTLNLLSRASGSQCSSVRLCGASPWRKSGTIGVPAIRLWDEEHPVTRKLQMSSGDSKARQRTYLT